MPIQDSDLFLININSDAQSFKITASKLKESLATNFYNNYKLLVNKPDYTSRFVYAQNLQQSVAPTDLMMVERAGVSYKVNGQQIIDYFPSVPAGAAGPIINVGKTFGPLEPTTLTPTPSPNVFQSCPPFNTAYASTLQLSGSTISYTFDGPWDMSSVTKYRGGAYDAGVAITLTFTDANGGSQSTTDTTAAGYAGYHDLSNIDFSVPIAMVTISIGSTPGWFWGFYDSSDQGVNYPDEVQSITDQLTLGSTTSLDLFTAGDAIKMVDSDGDVASYTPTTSTITNVSGNTLSFASPNKDLKYFNPGDTVQGTLASVTTVIPDGTNLNTDAASTNTDNITDGNPQTYFMYWSVPTPAYDPNNVVGDFTVTFSPPLINTSGLKLATSSDIDINGTPFSVGNRWSGSGGIPLAEIVNAPSTISSIKFKSGYFPATLGGIELNGRLLDILAKVVSTNTSNNSMVVDGGVWSTDNAGEYSDAFDGAYMTGDMQAVGLGGWDKMFNGVLGTTANDALLVNIGPTYESIFTFGTPITSVSKVQFWGYMQDSFGGDNPSTTYLIDGNGTEHNSGLPNIRDGASSGITPDLGDVITPVNGIVAIKIISTGKGGVIGGIYFDDELAVWVGENKVTGSAKSGTGNFLENTGPVVDITNSNNEWIDNDNRLGEDFFITNNSTRTGLAILRTKAVQLATTFNLTTTYQTGDLVIFNDCYWVSDNGSWLKISESTTTY